VRRAACPPELLLTDEPDRQGNPRLFFVRETVAQMLNEAQALLPKGFASSGSTPSGPRTS